MDLCRETVWDTPNDSTQYAKLKEADRVYDFLAGLNLKFDNVYGRILGQRPLPSLMEVCFEVCLEDDRTNAMGVLTTPTIDSAAFSARSSNYDSDKNNGKSIPVCKKRSSNEKQNLGHAYISETTPASTSQSIDPTARQTKTPTLGAIAQSGMPQSLGLISLDEKNPWILDSGATDHLTGSSEQFISYTPCGGNEKIRIADGSLAQIVSKGQIVPFDDFALQNVLHVPKLSYNLLSISKITRELHCKAIFLPESVYFQDMSSERTIDTTPYSRGLYILDDDTSCSSLSRVSLLSSYFSTSEQDWDCSPNLCAYTSQQNGVAERKNRHLVEVARSLMLSTSLPSYLWGDAILTVAYLINRMPSRILHLQTLLDFLKESYPSTRLVSEACVFVGYPLHQRDYKCFHPPSRKYFVTMDILSVKTDPTFPLAIFKGRVRNLIKEVGFPTSQPPAPIQDFEPPRDQEKNHDDETEARIETSNDEAEQGHTRNLITSLDSTIIPKNIYTALECPEWKNVVIEEMKALEKNRTWEICALPKRHKTVGCKWVFSLKYKADGMLDRHKARVLLSVAVNKDWPLYQLDVMNAFSNGDLIKEVYMSPPPGFEAQFGQQSQGYSQGHSDHTLFTKASKTGKIAILIVYVDDIVLTGDDQTEISQLKQRMGDEFEIKDLGNLKYFLGIEVARSKEGNSDDQVPVDKEQYQRLVGKLIYLSHTRPDISFVVSVVSQFMQAPYEKHMEAVNKILRYLKNTPGKGLMFRKTNRKTIEAYTDSNWAGSVIDRKSTSGYCTFVWGNLVTWRSKKQSVVARSSVEAEYRAMSLGICEEIWLQKVLSDLHQEYETPLKLFCDNEAAISIANNPVQHDRTKHVEIYRHFIKERLDSGNICIPYIPSSQQIADVLTKELLGPHFDLCVSKLGLIDIYIPT
ncbi:Retrovirus-related Pol polyprotein from transposon TNT 1-94 [Cucumis melo var. makuwa]|uniref:Retrovirus-related Pol polyprotein from transposon TNT 1-94 n=1 Tax=Cucumis melo var. makuwa TaxID=1194695 RepID=A0A5D3DR95_CUCMM|nr:Retrovirus-related Pol polyprotein from transposon TNT 1-94 [Cucumis melo var. makuwa]